MKNNSLKKITITGLFLAILIVLQYITKPMGQLVTGTCVNFVLIASTMLSGLWSGLVVAVISPFLAYAFGIGPSIFPIIPAIAVSNIVICVVYKYAFLLSRRNVIKGEFISWIIAIVFGALLKFSAIYLLVVKLILPMLSQIPQKQAAALSVAFGGTQFITAFLAGIIAVIVVPLVKKGIRK